MSRASAHQGVSCPTPQPFLPALAPLKPHFMPSPQPQPFTPGVPIKPASAPLKPLFVPSPRLQPFTPGLPAKPAPAPLKPLFVPSPQPCTRPAPTPHLVPSPPLPPPPPPKPADPHRDFFKEWTRDQLKEYLILITGSSKKYVTYSRDRLIDRLVSIELQQQQAWQQTAMPVRDGKTAAGALPGHRRKPSNTFRLSQLNARNRDSSSRICENRACRGSISTGDQFCRRCSCCICHSFDDNKDPSLWIECSGDAVDGKSSCGLSCHIECALDINAAGVVKRGSVVQLDGSYSCPSCGYISNLLGCWTKQLVIAREARRADVFCSRIARACRLLQNSVRYEEIQSLLRDANQELKEEIGGAGVSCRRLLNRLSCGASVQSAVEQAIAQASSWPSTPEKQLLYIARGGHIDRVYTIRHEDITSHSVAISWTGSEKVLGEEVIGHSIWCRPSAVQRYPSKPACSVGGADMGVKITGLEEGEEYVFKIVPFTAGGEVGELQIRCFTLGRSDKQSRKIEEVTRFHRMAENGKTEFGFRIREIGKRFAAAQKNVVVAEPPPPLPKVAEAKSKSDPAVNGSPECSASASSCMGLEAMNGRRCSRRATDEEVVQMVTRSKRQQEELQVDGTPASPKKRKLDAEPSSRKKKLHLDDGIYMMNLEECTASMMQKNFEFSVRMVVWLERQGYVTPMFRLKLLSWLGFQATDAEKKVVFVFIRTLVGDPATLAQQLIDAFQEIRSMRLEQGDDDELAPQPQDQVVQHLALVT